MTNDNGMGRPIKGDGQTCICEGCNNPRHKTYTRCLDHRREYEAKRKRERNAKKRAVMPPRKVLPSFPPLLVVEKVEGDNIGRIILYEAVRIISRDEARLVYGDSTRLARRDNCIILRAKIKVKGK